MANVVACGAALAGSAQIGSVALAVSSLHWLLNVLVQTQDINGRSDGKPMPAPQQRLLGGLDVLVIAGCAAYFMAFFQVAHVVAHGAAVSVPLATLWALPGGIAAALFINTRKGDGIEDHERIKDSHCALLCAGLSALAAWLPLISNWGQIDWIAAALVLGIWVWRMARLLTELLR
ncbi:hypothetical protein ACHMW6_25180 [Pseudoduganella sp. UC29_106]|uniref:hypothetical protein n=1 Tax=Pseudoduganella sp. UC29_106 TaxID=3374553 RepID=UPI0037567247